MKDIVAVSKIDEYDAKKATAALSEVIEKTGGLDFVGQGTRVAVKLNLVSMMKPEAAATTHPVLVKALCDILTNKGATVVLGDSPGGPYTRAYLQGVYARTGIKDISGENVLLNYNISRSEADFKQAEKAKTFDYTAWLDEADVIINFCKLKTHGMMAMSAAVKNLFGTIPGTFKPEYHFRYPNADDFADMLIDLNEYFKPALCIVDAVVGMEGNGPTMGKPRKIGAVLASRSPYALDCICADVIGVKREDIPTVKRATERGLCDEIEIKGDLDGVAVPDFELIRGRQGIRFESGGTNILPKLIQNLLSVAMTSKPEPCKAECIGCKKCAEICPAKAITMKKSIPIIDRKKCICCFCCQEFCPKGAMKVKRSVISRIINRR